MSDDEATHKLTTAMSAGDGRAVEVVYRTDFGWLYAQARRASRRDESFALDVVQDAVLRIIRTIRPVKSEGQLRAWMILVVQTTALDLLRSERRREKRQLVVVASSSDEAPEFDESDYQWLREQVQKLDPQIVRMIELRYEQHWTLGRIGKVFGLSIGTIDGRLRKALQELRDRAIEDLDV